MNTVNNGSLAKSVMCEHLEGRAWWISNEAGELPRLGCDIPRRASLFYFGLSKRTILCACSVDCLRYLEYLYANAARLGD